MAASIGVVFPIAIALVVLWTIHRIRYTIDDQYVRVVLGDTMGEMLAYCAAADVAFVGGSLLPLGGQNLIEPIALGVPVLVGPHTFNFAEATERAVEAGAARRVQDADALVALAAELLADDGARARMREAALAFHAQHRGAAERLWSWLGSRLPSPPTPLPPAGGTGE